MLEFQEIYKIFRKILNEKDIDRIIHLEGMTNSNFVIISENDQFVLRIPGVNSNSMINRKEERINQILTSKFGFNVPTIYFDDISGIKITKFLNNAKTLKPNTIKNHTEKIAKN